MEGTNMENGNEIEEFAPEYTQKEKLKILILGVVAGVLTVAIMKLWGFPKLREFAAVAHNVKVFGLPGTEVLLYGIFVGIPLIVMLSLLPLSIQGYRVLKDGQFPYKNSKVFKKTKIIRGKKALVRGWLLLSILPVSIVPLLYLSFSALNKILIN